MPFDRIVVAEGQSRRELTMQQFLELPLHRRIQHILARNLEFWNGSKPVDRGEALRGLSAWQAQGGAS